mmetsp:Transcript_21150/g.60443  ORF Transcript_21150/g.60443 Transcript_21150/m.60443 type:complete len:222 (+) Transcript_21150:334-999(+)
MGMFGYALAGPDGTPPGDMSVSELMLWMRRSNSYGLLDGAAAAAASKAAPPLPLAGYAGGLRAPPACRLRAAAARSSMNGGMGRAGGGRADGMLSWEAGSMMTSADGSGQANGSRGERVRDSWLPRDGCLGKGAESVSTTRGRTMSANSLDASLRMFASLRMSTMRGFASKSSVEGRNAGGRAVRAWIRCWRSGPRRGWEGRAIVVCARIFNRHACGSGSL